MIAIVEGLRVTRLGPSDFGHERIYQREIEETKFEGGEDPGEKKKARRLLRASGPRDALLWVELLNL
jgi:hypothetical protein